VKTTRRKTDRSNVRRQARAQKSQTEWNRFAERELKKVIEAAIRIPTVRKLGPKTAFKSANGWTVSVSLIGAPAMTRLNSQYRGKNRPTDVLSFPAPEVFYQQGHLGELIVCLPVLKRQARELGHKPEIELKILLVHGLLHLLGLDHELGPKQAAQQAKLEAKVLGQLMGRSKQVKRVPGLIQRAE
jgi:probable rRNA maturation factor